MTAESRRRYPQARFAETPVARLEEMIEEALRRGDLDSPLDRHGSSPLFLAVTCDRPDLVRRLLAAGADPNRADDVRHTPLHQAIGLNLNDIAMLIVADPRTIISTKSHLSDPPCSPRKWAESCGNSAMAAILQQGTAAQMTATYLVRSLDPSLVQLGRAASGTAPHTITLDADWCNGTVRFGLRAAGACAPQLSGALGSALATAGILDVRVEPFWTNSEPRSETREAKAYLGSSRLPHLFSENFVAICQRLVERQLLSLCSRAADLNGGLDGTLVFPCLSSDASPLVAATVNPKIARAAVRPSGRLLRLDPNWTIDFGQRDEPVTVVGGEGLETLLNNAKSGPRNTR